VGDGLTDFERELLAWKACERMRSKRAGWGCPDRPIGFPRGKTVPRKRSALGELAAKVHVFNPYVAGRSVCGRRLPAAVLVTSEAYRRTPSEMRCRKCAINADLPERVARLRAETLNRPGRQLLLWEVLG
jgi:hypothetical protein